MNLRKINVDDFQLSKVQDNVDAAFSTLQRDNPFLNGVFVTATIQTFDTAVDHGLQRALNGYIIVGRNANAVIYTSTTNNLRPTDLILLKASATVTANIYFF
jgi:hypothetical protein